MGMPHKSLNFALGNKKTRKAMDNKENKKFCPHCGEELVDNGYNYDNGHSYYYCEHCDIEMTEIAVLDEDEANEQFGVTL